MYVCTFVHVCAMHDLPRKGANKVCRDCIRVFSAVKKTPKKDIFASPIPKPLPRFVLAKMLTKTRKSSVRKRRGESKRATKTKTPKNFSIFPFFPEPSHKHIPPCVKGRGGGEKRKAGSLLSLRPPPPPFPFLSPLHFMST